MVHTRSSELLSTESIFYLQNRFLSTQPYFYLQNMLGSPFYRVCTIPDRQRDSKIHLRASSELLSTESNLYLQNLFLSTQPYFYPQNVLGSPFCRVHGIPGRQRGSEMHFENPEYIIIYRIEFLSTE